MKKFLEALGSQAVSPGGGSAAALTLALGIALAEMTARINQKRLGPTPASKARIAYFARARKGALRLMRLDERAFLSVSKQFKKDREGGAYQKCLKEAARVPFEMCGVAANVLAKAAEEKPRTGKWLASDLAEAGILLEAAFAAARLNVEINLKSIRDAGYVKTKSDWLGHQDARMKAVEL